MKQTLLTGLVLTLLTLLLVAAATLFFLLPQRQTLRGQVERLTEESVALENRLAESDAALAARDAALADAEAELANAVATRDATQQAADDRQRELNDVISERDQARAELAAMLDAPPEIRFVAPAAGAELPWEAPVAIQAAVADPAGVTAVELMANDESIATFEPSSEPLFIVDEAWAPGTPGVYTLTLRAGNSLGHFAAPVTRTITVLEPALTVTESLALQRQAIEADVNHLRGLEAREPIQPTLLTSAGLRARVEEDFLADWTPAQAADEVRALAAFDFVAPDFDLYTYRRELFSTQFGGFYDPETNELVVISDDNALNPLEASIHAHEYAHALQDQHFTLPPRLDERVGDAEARRGLQALVEGEASLVELLYLAAAFTSPAEALDTIALLPAAVSTEVLTIRLVSLIPDADRIALAALAGQRDTTLLDEGPAVIVNQLRFPYQAGLAFAYQLYAANDSFAGVDAAWQRPPRSTEQILHPQRYLAGDEPQTVFLPSLAGLLGPGWRLIEQDVLGEFLLREYLAQQLDEQTVNQAALGWGGDRYAVYTRDSDGALVMVLRLAWDTSEDADEFGQFYPAYPAALFGVAGSTRPDSGVCWSAAETICLYTPASESVIIRAPDTALAGRVATAILDLIAPVP